MTSFAEIQLEALRCPVAFEGVSILFRSLCQLGELPRRQEFHVTELTQHSTPESLVYELPEVLRFRCPKQ